MVDVKKDFYKILEVDQKADLKAIKNAYRERFFPKSRTIPFKIRAPTGKKTAPTPINVKTQRGKKGA